MPAPSNVILGVGRPNLRTPKMPPLVFGNQWNPADKSASVVLSNNNQTAAAINDSAASFQSGRALVGVLAGQKKYWRVTVTALPTATGNVAHGFASDQFAFTSFIGAESHSAAMYFNDARLFVNNVGNAVTTGWTLNVTTDYAVDHSADLAWSRVNNGVWNAGGGADPATGTGGFSIAALVGAQSPPILYPAFELIGDAGGVATIVLDLSGVGIPSGSSGF